MLEVTDAAKRQLGEVTKARGLDPGKFLRLAVPPVWTGNGDFGIVIDARGVMDVAVAHDGRTVLLIEQEIAEKMGRAVLDFKPPPDGPRFTLDVY